MTKENKQGSDNDLTGQSRFVWNLFVSWTSQIVLIFSGFVMPRLVNDKVGQDALGIWDFGWSFVSYLTLVGLGMGACFNRYISKHRAIGEFKRLNQVANSVVFVQIIICCLVLLFTLSFYFLIPYFFAPRLADNLPTAQWVVLFLGASLAVQMLSGSARGLLTGYHRWDIHNALHAGSSLFSLSLMVSFLYFTDLNVVGMAIGYFISTICFESLRFFFVYKVCHEFHFNLRMASLATCKEMLFFGIKSMISNLPPILLLQTINILLFSAVGPAALAVFARPMALTKQIKTFMTKFTLMLTPTTGSMQGAQDNEAIKSLFISTTQLSFAFSLPTLGILFVFGDLVLKYWMGPNYALWSLMMILAIGQLLPMAQDTSIRILMGLNKHGKISVFAFISIFILFAIGLLITGLSNWKLTTAALLFVIPMNIVYGVIVPYYTCKLLKISFKSYLQNTLIKPVLIILPFFILLSFSRYSFSNNDNIMAIVYCSIANLLTLLLYIIFYLPHKTQQKILRFLPFYQWFLRMKS
jgi:O-antigen/teichoic acid export membrane protein